jgi:hypothetical protein
LCLIGRLRFILTGKITLMLVQIQFVLDKLPSGNTSNTCMQHVTWHLESFLFEKRLIQNEQITCIKGYMHR